MTGERKQPKVKLIGRDGNAFAIMRACKEAWKKAKLPMEEWEAIRGDMMSGDYSHLLGVAMEHFDVY